MKKIIKEEIYSKIFKGDYHEIKISDIPKDVQDNDIINIQRCETYVSENESYDAFTQLEIYREREETDKEYEKRLSKEQKLSEELKKRRYETYLKLKKEFENDGK